MFEHKVLGDLNDYFLELGQRKEKGVYFYRLNGYNNKIKDFIVKFYDTARREGVVIEGKIPNPDEKNLAYYQEIMGSQFRMDESFITTSLKKWLPRMNDLQRSQVASSIFRVLDDMRKAGKNENMLKNAYIKFMCWLYYKFERIVNQLGNNRVPKILYEGQISNYELKLITVLMHAGCDVILLQYQGDESYLKLDPSSTLSGEWKEAGMTQFPKEFNLKWVQEQIRQKLTYERLYGVRPQIIACTNAWIKGKGLEDIQTPLAVRGEDSRFFYNCFIRISGAQDKVTYLNELYQMQKEIKNSQRKILILEKEISPPTMEEINQIHRNSYTKIEQLIQDLSKNINFNENNELQRLMNQTFIDIMLEESKIAGMNLNKLTNKAVYLLCYLRRYQSQLFAGWKMPQIGCLIYYGGCQNENEALFLRFMSRLPVDVLILVPNLNKTCCLADDKLFELHYQESISAEEFPKEDSGLRMGTAAYHAERELDTVMYQDSGMYRNKQYDKANIVSLVTMYEEIEILWDQEMKYRPNFGITDDVVSLPVIFAKVSGVKDQDIAKYWDGVRKLVTQDTYVITKAPFLSSTEPNPMKAFATDFYKNGRLLKSRIKEHPQFPYSFLREEMQDYILEKLELLINQKLIKGTFENGTEYTIVATVLNLNKEILRLIQKFDFTKKNPKLIYINTTETTISLEDSILSAFLNLIGFDIIFFVPTGYQSVERYFNKKVMEEHQIGDYMYDLQVPNLGKPADKKLSWRERLFHKS